MGESAQATTPAFPTITTTNPNRWFLKRFIRFMRALPPTAYKMRRTRRMESARSVKAEGFGEPDPKKNGNHLHNDKGDDESDHFAQGSSHFSDVGFVIRNEVE